MTIWAKKNHPFLPVSDGFLALFLCDLLHTLSVHFLFSTTGRLAFLYVLLELILELLWDYPSLVFL